LEINIAEISEISRGNCPLPKRSEFIGAIFPPKRGHPRVKKKRGAKCSAQFRGRKREETLKEKFVKG